MTAVLVPQYFGSLLFERNRSRYLPFDADTTQLLERLIDAPIDRVYEETELHERPALQGLFDMLQRRGLIDFCGKLAADRLAVEPADDHLTGPLAVHLEIMGACNLSCTHCFAMPLPRHRDPLTLAEIDDLAGQLAAIGSFRLGLTGGEPLMRKDFFDVVDCAGQHGLHPCLTTNGLMVDEGIARRLGERRFTWVNVSLEGPDAASNDAVRGEGAFERACAAIRLLAEHTAVTVAFTLTADNHLLAERCAELARELGASTAVFRPLYPVGAASTASMPSFSEYTDALERLSGSWESHGIDPFGPARRRPVAARTYTGPGCGAAHLVASVDVSGQVNPCSFLGPSTDAGSIRHRRFRDIWDDGIAFRRLRGPALKGFTGGCRARAAAMSGDFDAVDPWQVEHDAGLGRAPAANVEVG